MVVGNVTRIYVFADIRYKNKNLPYIRSIIQFAKMIIVYGVYVVYRGASCEREERASVYTAVYGDYRCSI